ncbi:uncharacterized protein SOCEGT47_036820 [Sorangium cellulosum]|uniref:Uncharacterized protein n=1 Tax=Sorangium cellulosum TaxID=56 RepID=A0A4P2Q2R9_SORCE|nr:uncharacterized protein SOCEGT47_036820 [Sorangium cellulosum]
MDLPDFDEDGEHFARARRATGLFLRAPRAGRRADRDVAPRRPGGSEPVVGVPVLVNIVFRRSLVRLQDPHLRREPARPAPRADLDGGAVVVLERADGAIRLDDRPRVLAAVARDHGAAAAAHGDVEVDDPRSAHGEHPVTSAADELELLGDDRAALGHVPFDRLGREPPHAVRRAAEQRQARDVLLWVAGEPEVAVAAHPRAAHAHRRDGQIRILEGAGVALGLGGGGLRQLAGLDQRRGLWRRRREHGRRSSLALPGARRVAAPRGDAPDEQGGAEARGPREMRRGARAPARHRGRLLR